ncbi:MAG TPA: HAMP domain-containing sensor histidine kinase [Pseudogracilibacillus sp.]|nr:HAMP domain-containing sensor histidine kinase [Pseudogracilibacillus sp.]
MNGWMIFGLCMVVIAVLCIYKLLIIRWDMKKMAGQLKDVNEHFGSNELIRTNSHDQLTSEFAKEINKLIHLYKENERYLEKRETQLRTEITNISHDLRTPLTSMKGFSQLLLEDVPVVKRKEYVDIILGKIDLLTNQVDLFYELASIHSADYKLEMTLLSLNEVIEEKALLFYPDFRKRSLDVQLVNMKESHVIASEEALGRVLVNIIQNALRYATSYFRLKLQEEEKHFYLYAENDVEELTEEDIALIFNRSYRKEPSRTSGQLGLGLHIVKQLMEKQGGEVTARLDDKNFLLQLKFYKPS